MKKQNYNLVGSIRTDKKRGFTPFSREVKGTLYFFEVKLNLRQGKN